MLRILHCVDNQLIDGGKVISPMHRPCSTPQKRYFFCFWYSFLLEAEQSPRPSAVRGGDPSHWLSNPRPSNLSALTITLPSTLYLNEICAISVEVCRRIPTKVARVRYQVRSYGICRGQSCARVGFVPSILILHIHY
jgi:hypothetical protein